MHEQRDVVERRPGRGSTGWPSDSSSARRRRPRRCTRGRPGPSRPVSRRPARRCGARPDRRRLVGGHACGRRAAYGSPGIAPAITSSTAALSRTDRRDHVAYHEPRPRLAVVGPERDAAARGLEPEQPARAGGDADGAAAVARVAKRHHARRHRGAAAAARAARAWSVSTGCATGRTRVDSVVGSSPSSGVLVLPTITKPAARSVANRYESWSAVCRAPEQPVARRWSGSPASDAVEVLHHDRARRGTGRRADRRRRRLRRARDRSAVDHRVELRVDGVDARDRGVDELARRGVAVADERGLVVASSTARSVMRRTVPAATRSRARPPTRACRAQALVARRPQHAGARPLVEGDLDHELGLDPRRRRELRGVGERVLSRDEWREQLLETRAGGLVDARADAARELERAVVVVVPDEQ